jgi:hypothetical protein
VKNDFRKQNKYTCSNRSERREGGVREKEREKEKDMKERKQSSTIKMKVMMITDEYRE